MSTHEKRLAALQTEIQALEAENVGTKEWTLLGEASARTRPHDALLGHDLDFDRATRTVPIVTDAVVAALEDRIKARIKDGRFDDVVRGRAAGDAVPWVSARAVEGLQDAQSAQSLAQIYEGAYVAAQSGAPAAVDDRDGRLRREHDEIARVWEGICAKLDALCNAHYVPKPVRIVSPLSLLRTYGWGSRRRASRPCRTYRLHPWNRRSRQADRSPARSRPRKSWRPHPPLPSVHAAN